MPTDLVPIKIKITRNPDGSMKHPDFRGALTFFAKNPDYISDGIYYDRTSDCQDSSPESPLGQRWAMKLVPQAFATEAVAQFPNDVAIMTELQCQDFWDNKAHINAADNKTDSKTLQDLRNELKLRQEAGLTTTAILAKIAKALDPDDPEPGVERNKLRRWVDAKASKDINIP